MRQRTAARSVPGIVVAAAVLVAPLAAYANERWSGTVPVKARTLAERGRAFHDAGDYEKAITAFTHAYVMAPSPALLFNLAQAYRLQGECDDAALMYRRYLATNPSPEERALAETHLVSVERCVHKRLALHIPGEVGTGRAAGSARRPVATSATARAPSRKGELTKDVGIGLVLGGSVALGVAAYYTVRAHDAANEVADAYAMGAKWKDIAPIDERGKSAATTAKIVGAGGALGLASGVVTYLIGKHAERAPLTVIPKAHGVEVSMLWAF